MNLDLFVVVLASALIKENTTMTRSATNYLGQAYYYQSGLHAEVAPLISNINNKLLPKEAVAAGAGLIFFYKIAKDNKIELAWSF